MIALCYVHLVLSFQRLLRAAADEEPDLIRELIEEGADPNFITPLSRLRATPLIIAAFNGNPLSVRVLIELGADPTISMPDTETNPLRWAVVKSFPEVVIALVEGGLDVDEKFGTNQTQLHEAASDGNLEMVEVLAELGANVDEKSSVDGDTPLILAALRGHKDVLEFLIENGADPGIKNIFGGTALHFAAVFGQEAVISPLIEAGANVDEQDDVGRTPAHLAAFEGYKGIVALLLDAGADISIPAVNADLPVDIVCGCLGEENDPGLKEADGFPSSCEDRCTLDSVEIQDLLKST